MKLNLYPYSLTRPSIGYGYIATCGVHYYHQALVKQGKCQFFTSLIQEDDHKWDYMDVI
jgi:hypothetical protein